jgi:hypothetical protein
VTPISGFVERSPGRHDRRWDDRGERRRGNAVSPRVTLRQDVFEQADVTHGPGKRRARSRGVPSGPMQCPQFSPPFYDFERQKKQAAADVTPAEAFLDFTPARHLRQPGNPVRLGSRRLGAPDLRLILFPAVRLCAASLSLTSFHTWALDVR